VIGHKLATTFAVGVLYQYSRINLKRA